MENSRVAVLSFECRDEHFYLHHRDLADDRSIAIPSNPELTQIANRGREYTCLILIFTG